MENNRFKIVPIIAGILKVLAVLALIFLVYQAFTQFGEAIRSWKGGAPSPPYGMPGPAIKGFGARFHTLLSPLFSLVIGILLPSLIWGAGELLQMLRGIEFNTRARSATAGTATLGTPSSGNMAIGGTEVQSEE